VNESDPASRPDAGDLAAAGAAVDDVDLPGDLDDFGDEQFDSDDMDDVTKAKLAAALAVIDAQFGRPPAEQVEGFARAHQALQETLNRIDAG
jgi:hypothetical protein